MSYNSPFTGNVIQPTDVSYRSITLSADTTLAWPINGNPTGDYAARIMEVTATTGSLSLLMPPANQASVGQDALIRNVGSNTFTVKDYQGNTIVSVVAGQAQYIYITVNSTTGGTWGIIAYGIGSSGADAATLAGYGLLAVGQTLNVAEPVTTFSATLAVGLTYRGSLLAFTGGASTATLASTTTLGNNYFVSVRNAGTGSLTIATTGGDVINGSSTITLQPADSCVVVCSGSAFYTVGLGKSTQFNFTVLTKAVTTGTYTLTSAEAANVIQKYTGTLTGNVTIVVPPTVQVYYVQNSTSAGSGGYTITITTNVSGGSTAAITAGNQATLICDSVNVVNANTVLAGLTTISLADGTVGSPSLAFSSESSTGIYRPTSGQFGIAILGSNLLTLTASGLTINGTGTFTGGVYGGAF
tara:strand:+ start:2066 stop:3307 length:1242 start_codon:yes stop_codon:yes gene_type:complete